MLPLRFILRPRILAALSKFVAYTLGKFKTASSRLLQVQGDDESVQRRLTQSCNNAGFKRMSETSSPREYILSNDGGPTSTDQSTSSEGAESEEAERGSTERQETQAKQTKHGRQNSEPDAGPKDKHPQERAEAKMRGNLNKGYRDLLNAVIEEAAGVVQRDVKSLPPSQIGASFWTSSEKEVFFSALARHGRDNLRALSSAIVTKTEPEVRSYLLLLQTNNSHDGTDSVHLSNFSITEVPAAYEIGDRCETALNIAAEALDRQIIRHDIGLERERFGEFWLIDEQTTVEMGEGSEQPPGFSVSHSEAAPKGLHESTESETDERSDPAKKAEDTHKGRQEGQPGNIVESSGPQSFPADLLRPESFLALSRQLFMNSAIDVGSNWSNLGSSDLASSTPAMFRSAFDDFHSIAVSLTRRLVQASLFQAMSRLRAKYDRSPDSIVTEGDVRTCLALLGFDKGWKKYWSTVARRCGVDVYSESNRFQDGRPGTKTGVKLTWEEVESELGFPREHPDLGSATATHNQLRATREGQHIQQEDEDSSHSLEDSIYECESMTKSGDTDSGSSSGPAESAKRKRSSTSHDGEEEVDDNEEDYLNVGDIQASRVEERRLLKVLQQTVSPPPEPESQSIPRSDRAKRARLDTQRRWRDQIRYQAEWEQHPHLMNNTDRD